MSWFFAALKKYAVFRGRASRSEFWYFILFVVLISIVLGFMDAIARPQSQGEGLLSGLFSLAMLLPALGVQVRRLHDIGRSGWWILLSFVPLIGALVLLVFAVRDSEPGDNVYGPNPKLAPPSDALV